MRIKQIHKWNLSIDDAKKIQDELRDKVELNCPIKSLNEIKTVAGCDVFFSKDNKYIRAAVVVLTFPELKILEKVQVNKEISNWFPYIPGLLSFREGPVLLDVFTKLKTEPDVVLFDGQGTAHPKKLGIASHIGIFLDKPTIGCAKKPLYGKYEEPPPSIRGSYNYIKSPDGDIIGIVLRTKPYVKPVFVSTGFKMDLNIAGDVVIALCKKYRIPQPLRFAHQHANASFLPYPHPLLPKGPMAEGKRI